MHSISASSNITHKDRVISFLWQHLLLLCSLMVMTLGVALCVRSALGSSVISSVPLAFTMAGAKGMAPQLTIGSYTYIMNFMLVGGQIIVLRRRFELVQLFQLVIGFAFGFCLDLSMALTSWVDCSSLPAAIAAQLIGCIILAVGIAFEIRCGSVTMPGEGMPAAISRATSMPFAKAKIIVDISLVACAIIAGYAFFGCWLEAVIGPGTLFAMVFVGWAVKILAPRTAWFSNIVAYRPGFRRYIYGLARYVRNAR